MLQIAHAPLFVDPNKLDWISRFHRMIGFLAHPLMHIIYLIYCLNILNKRHV